MKSIAIILTNADKYEKHDIKTGLWLSELTHFYHKMKKGGLEVDFISPLGGQIPLDPVSLKSIHMDKISRDYYENKNFMNLLQNTKSISEVNAEDYRAIYFTGGHGTMFDFPNHSKLENFTSEIYKSGGLVAAVCHGVGILSTLKSDGKFLAQGKDVTGFSNFEEFLSGHTKHVPFLLENELKNIGANYSKAILPFVPYTKKDGRLLTGQNPQSTKKLAEDVYQELMAL